MYEYILKLEHREACRTIKMVDERNVSLLKLQPWKMYTVKSLHNGVDGTHSFAGSTQCYSRRYTLQSKHHSPAFSLLLSYKTRMEMLAQVQRFRI